MDPYNPYGIGGSGVPYSPVNNAVLVYNNKVKAVHGREGAKAVRLMEGCSVILPDDTEKIMWFISSDAFGIKTITAYPYDDPIEVDDTPQKQAPQPQSEETPVYVQTKEFDELKGSVDDLRITVNKLVSELGGDKS